MEKKNLDFDFNLDTNDFEEKQLSVQQEKKTVNAEEVKNNINALIDNFSFDEEEKEVKEVNNKISNIEEEVNNNSPTRSKTTEEVMSWITIDSDEESLDLTKKEEKSKETLPETPTFEINEEEQKEFEEETPIMTEETKDDEEQETNSIDNTFAHLEQEHDFDDSDIEEEIFEQKTVNEEKKEIDDKEISTLQNLIDDDLEEEEIELEEIKDKVSDVSETKSEEEISPKEEEIVDEQLNFLEDNEIEDTISEEFDTPTWDEQDNIETENDDEKLNKENEETEVEQHEEEKIESNVNDEEISEESIENVVNELEDIEHVEEETIEHHDEDNSSIEEWELNNEIKENEEVEDFKDEENKKEFVEENNLGEESDVEEEIEEIHLEIEDENEENKVLDDNTELETTEIETSQTINTQTISQENEEPLKEEITTESRVEEKVVEEKVNKRINILLLDDKFWKSLSVKLKELNSNYNIFPSKDCYNPSEYNNLSGKADFILLDHWFANPWEFEEPLAIPFIQNILDKNYSTPVICISDNLDVLLKEYPEWNELAKRNQLLAFTDKDAWRIDETIKDYYDDNLELVSPYVNEEINIRQDDTNPFDESEEDNENEDNLFEDKSFWTEEETNNYETVNHQQEWDNDQLDFEEDDEVENITYNQTYKQEDEVEDVSLESIQRKQNENEDIEEVDISAYKWMFQKSVSQENKNIKEQSKWNKKKWWLVIILILVALVIAWYFFKDQLIGVLRNVWILPKTQQDKEQEVKEWNWDGETSTWTTTQTEEDKKQEKEKIAQESNNLLQEQKKKMEESFPFYKVVSTSDVSSSKYIWEHYWDEVQLKFDKILDPQLSASTIFVFQYKPVNLSAKKLISYLKDVDSVSFNIIARIYWRLNWKDSLVKKYLKTENWKNKLKTVLTKQFNSNKPFLDAVNKELKASAEKVNNRLLLFVYNAKIKDLRQSIVETKASIQDILSWEEYTYFDKWLNLPENNNYNIEQEQKLTDLLLQALLRSKILVPVLEKNREKILAEAEESSIIKDWVDLVFKLDFYNQFLLQAMKNK